MGLACLAAHLAGNDILVKVMDANIRLYNDAGEGTTDWWSMDSKARWVYPSLIGKTWDLFSEHLQKYLDELVSAGAPVYGFSVHSDNRLCTKLMIEKLKQRCKDAKIIVGGMGVSSLAERKAFGKGLVDYFVIGEGETTLLELAKALKENKQTSEIKGVSAWTGTVYTEPEPRPWAKNLDDFTQPTFDGFDLAAYSTPNLPVLTSRGCTKGCVICNDRVLMGKYRSASAKTIFAEIEHHVEELGVHDFMFNDLQINNNLSELDRFCSKVIEAEFKIRWNANAVVDDAIKPDLLRNLAAAGCHTLDLGLESGAPNVVKAINKGFTIEQAERLMVDIKAAGIMLWINLVIGFPTETEEDFELTCDFVTQHADKIDAVAVMNTCNILDHSILAKRREKYGIAEPVDPDWFEVNWETLDGANTPAIRADRQQRMTTLLNDLKIPVRQSNASFEDEDSHLASEQQDLLMVLAPPFDVSMPPYDLARAAGFLENSSVRIIGMDLNIEIYKHAPINERRLWQLNVHDTWADPKTFARYAKRLNLDFDRIAKRICSVNTTRIYFHAVRGNLNFLIELAQRIRQIDPDKKLIYGGPSMKIEAERSLLTDEIADFFVMNEPEISLLELLERLKNDRLLKNIRGVMYTMPDGNKHLLPREPLRDMDKLGYPSFRQFKPDRYLSPKLPISAGKGCAYRCAFCSEQPEQGPHRSRSALNVFEEMVAHYETWDVFTFVFNDLVIDCDLEILVALCDLIIDSGYPFLWTADIAPRADLTPRLFEKMKKSGCTALIFGVESFSDSVLCSMNKTYKAADAIRNLHDAHDAGIETHIALIIGWPNESNDDFYDTARAIKQNIDVIDFVDTITALYVSPGSLIEQNMKKWDIYLPPGFHYDNWDQRGRNNKGWRKKRVREMAVFLSKLPVKLNYDFFVPPSDSFRKIEDRIYQRFEQRMKPEPQVLLVTAPPWGYENPPVGLAYLSTYLKHHDIPCEALDFNIEFYNSVFDIYKMLWHVENKNYWSNEKTFEVVKYSLNEQIDLAVEKMYNFGVPLIGFSVVDPKERITIEMIRRLRRDNYEGKIILGGPACHTPDYRQIFIDQAGDMIDGFCIGEGEKTLLECAKRVIAGESLQGVPGLMWLDENNECRVTERPVIDDLDTIPFPTYEEFDFSKYPGDSLIVEWSRGCIGTCTYCKGREIAGKYRTHSAKHIFEELKNHYYKSGYDNFTVCDPLINGTPAVLEELCDLIIEDGLKIRWNGEGIPLPGLTRDILDKMQKAGCYELQLGLECGSENVLKKMGKLRLFTIEQARQVIRDTHEAGIKTCLFVIVGFPGETEEDFVQTLEFIDSNAKWINQVKSINSLHVITDTPIHKHPDKFGIVLPNIDYHYLWADENGMDWPERNKRIRRVLALCEKHGIEVRETNLAEGKQYDLEQIIGAGELSIEQQMEKMIKQINELQSFEAGDAQVELNQPGGPVTYPAKTGQNEPEPVETEPETEPEPEPEPKPAEPFKDDREKKEFVRENLHLAGVLDGKEVFAGPEILEIDVTNACNCNCVGCWNHSDMMGDDKYTGEEFKRRLPTKMVLETIDTAAKLGAKMVQLSGAGEPFMHPDIIQIIERVKRHGLKCTIITNGTLLDTNKARRLVELGVDDLTVSVWAGTPKMYKATHPKMKGKTLYKIRDILRFIHDLKIEKGQYLPHVKIYNVISKVNAGGITDMIDFALDCLADYIEFTPVDIISGKTDQLALDNEARKSIAAQLESLVSREDYLELEPTLHDGKKVDTKEVKEFARFIKRDLLSDWFKYELDDISRFDVLCPRKEWRLDVQEDNIKENALLFYYPNEECDRCPLADKCPIDTERYAVKVEFLSVLGFGSFYRRITSPEAAKGEYDSEVRDLPCLVGWTYARLLTTGEVIPCCKGDDAPMGNIIKGGFKTVWTAATYREFREKAKTLPKDDPYFDPIQCLVACDNLGQNLGTMERLKKLNDQSKKALENPKSAGFKKL